MHIIEGFGDGFAKHAREGYETKHRDGYENGSAEKDS
jgi:hypothetical protein